VYRLTDGLSQNRRCLAIVVFGWTPAGVSQSLAEGHNDIAMVALALLWLYLVDALYALRYERIGWRRYALRLAPAAALGLATMALFYRSPEYFDGVRLIGAWYF